MTIPNLQRIYIKGRFTLPIICILYTLVWISGFLLNIPNDNKIEVFQNLNSLSVSPFILSKSIAFISYTVIGYLLIGFNNTFNIISKRATVHSSLFLLLVASIPQIQAMYSGPLVTLLFLFTTFFFFKTYKNKSQQTYFYLGIWWGITFLTLPKIVLLLPFMVIYGLSTGSFKFKEILASLLGILLPIWILFSYGYLFNQIDIFYHPFLNLVEWNHPLNFKFYPSGQIFNMLFIAITFLLACLYVFLAQPKMKIRTSYFLNYFFTITVGLITLIILDPTNLNQYTPLYLVCISFIITNTLFAYQNKLSNILFSLLLLTLISLLAVNLWTPLFNF